MCWSCIFCNYQTEDSWNQNSQKQSLNNPQLFRFFCRQLGIDRDEVPFKTLDDIPVCLNCQDLYDELHALFIQIEALKLNIKEKIETLRQKVISSPQQNDVGTDFQDRTIKIRKFREIIQNQNRIQLHGLSTSEFQDSLIKVEDIKEEFSEQEYPVDDYEGDNDNFDIVSCDMDEEEYPDFPDPEVEFALHPEPDEDMSDNSFEDEEISGSSNDAEAGNSSTKLREKATAVTDASVARKTGRYKKKEGAPPIIGLTIPGENKEVKCPICQKHFLQKDKLTRHYRAVHEKHRPHQCQICSKTFSMKTALHLHTLKHETDEKNLSCSICGKMFTHQVNLDRHESRHKLDATKPLFCQYCDTRYPAEGSEALERHMQSIHAAGPSKISKPLKFTCTLCNKGYANRTEILKHDYKTHPEKFNLHCPHAHCDKRYYIQEFLDTHLKTHDENEVGPFKCTVCNAMLHTSDKLSEHLLRHTGEKNKKCEDCLEFFFEKEDLERHRINEHGYLKRYQCQHCQQRYFSPTELRGHIREVHESTPNAFNCDKCENKFKSEKNLKQHVQRVHDSKMSVVCEICGKSLSGRKSYNDHLNSHNGIKPYQCSYCGLGFVKQFTLKCHVLTHTGEKPFKCKICPKEFTQRHCLKAHVKKFHDQEDERETQ